MKRGLALAIAVTMVTGCGWLTGYDFDGARPMDTSDAGAQADGEPIPPVTPAKTEETGSALREGTGRVGAVLLSSGTDRAQVSAFFHQQGQGGVYALEPTGACNIVFSALDIRPGVSRPAGALHVFRGDGSRLATLAPEADDSYGPLDLEGARRWGADEPLFVQAEGQAGAVPRFTVSTFGVAGVEVTSPVVPADGSPLALARASDLTLTWRGGDARRGRILVTLMEDHDEASSFNLVSCGFPRSAGTGVVPARALGVLRRSVTWLKVLPAEASEVREGEWAITVTSEGAGLDWTKLRLQ